MSEASARLDVVEVQVLSLQQNANINAKSSPAHQALLSDLKVISLTPRCIGVFWISDELDHLKLLIITKWKREFEEIGEYSRLPALREFASSLSSTRFMNVNLQLVASGYVTFQQYFSPFPMSREHLSKSRQFAKAIIEKARYDQSEPRGYKSATWSIQVSPAEKRTTALTTISVTPRFTDQDRVRILNTLNKQFMDDMKHLGWQSRQFTHGKVHNVSKYAFEDSDSGSENDIEEAELDSQLNYLSEAVARIRAIAQLNASSIGTRDHHDCVNFLPPNEQGGGPTRRLRRIE